MYPLFALFNLALIVGAAFFGIRAYGRAYPDTSAVRGSRMLSSRSRAWYFSNLTPFEDLFVRLGVPAAVLSWSQLAVSGLVGLTYAQGLIYTAGFLTLFTGTLDILDGKVARRTVGGTPAGAYLDSVIDRYAEFVGYVGLVFLFRSGWQVWMVVAAMLGGMMVSYTRARAEGLGISCEIGLLQRPERYVILGFGSIFSSIAVSAFGGRHLLLEITITLLAVLSNATALQRAVYSHRLLRERRREAA